ncbi:hypothetical protein ACS0TY_017551 [Phlomoides rotata]
MASSMNLTVVERCLISPQQSSAPPLSLPLTHFDIPFLLFSPNQPLFFYDLPISSAVFTKTLLPKLKRTLSLTLRHFFPLAGKLVMPTARSDTAHLEFTEEDSVPLTAAVAEATEFTNLIADNPKTSRDFHDLVPKLGFNLGSKKALLAIQITVFPEIGISIGFTLRNVVADWRTFNNFLRAWASLSKNGGIMKDDVAFHDRSVILDPIGLKSTLLKGWKELKEGSNYGNRLNDDTVRSTFVFGPRKVEQIKNLILTRSDMLFGSGIDQFLLSPNNICCAFIWVCWTKLHCSGTVSDCQNVHYFGYTAGGVPRVSYSVPETYVGNCVGFGRASLTRSELLGENGVVRAAKSIGDTVTRVNGDIMDGSENWISDWQVMRESELHIIVTGSPKLSLYGLDFGWGKPVKFEEVSIDVTGAISVTETRRVVGGIELGVALTKSKMDALTAIVNKELDQYLIVNGS